MGLKIKNGALLIHGLTGTPENLAPIAKALRARGFLVKTPLLHGHGVDLQTLSKTKWSDWYRSVREAFRELTREAENIYYVGLSLGALLGLKLAMNSGNTVRALALLGVPIYFKPLFRYLVIPGVRYTPLRFFIHSTAKNFEKSILDPVGQKRYRQTSLHRLPSPTVYETTDLAKEIRQHLNKIKQPLLLIHGAKDHIVDPKSYEFIQGNAASKQIDYVVMKNSAHVLSWDYQKEEVAKRIADFFAAVPLPGTEPAPNIACRPPGVS